MSRVRMFFHGLIICTLLISCSTQSERNTNQSSDTISMGIKSKLTIGEWLICEKIDGMEKTNFNQCPVVVFEPDGKGKYIDASSEVSYFTWLVTSLNKVELEITTLEADDILLENGNYQMDFTEEDDLTQLRLVHSNLELIYILGHEKK